MVLTTMPGGVLAVLGSGRAGNARRRLDPAISTRVLAIVAAGVVAVLLSEQADWEPLSLVVALAATMVIADVISFRARRVRISEGLVVQVVAMALLGPAAAAAIGALATAADALVNRLRFAAALNNIAIFAFLGLLGGVLFEVAGNAFGLEPQDSAYALLVAPLYLVIAGLNLCLVAAMMPGLDRAERPRLFRESGLPTLPIEFLNALIAAAVVLVWAHASLAAAAALLLLLVVTVPLLYTVGSALKSGDDLLALRDISDQRAADVARLASDRERLLSEVLEAEERERARLAESLHDGPVQRLAAIRQEIVEGTSPEELASHLGAALAETRAIISAFHPVAVRQLGFEASLRAAIAPFPAARTVELTVRSTVDDRFLAGTLLLPVAQELVVNAVKHASPSRISLSVRAGEGHTILEVNDDGVGIDTSDAAGAVQAGHLGLAMVRRRVEDAGGVLDIETRPDGGTRSRMTLPIKIPA